MAAFERVGVNFRTLNMYTELLILRSAALELHPAKKSLNYSKEITTFLAMAYLVNKLLF